mgnify:CR=1 FL=1
MLIRTCSPTRPVTAREKASRNANDPGRHDPGPPPGSKSTKPARSGASQDAKRVSHGPGPPKRKEAPGRGRGPLETHAYLEKPFYFAACLRAERTAASMALLVTVAPATPSMSALWASSTCWA